MESRGVAAQLLARPQVSPLSGKRRVAETPLGGSDGASKEGVSFGFAQGRLSTFVWRLTSLRMTIG